MVGNKDFLQILKEKNIWKNYPACKELTLGNMQDFTNMHFVRSSDRKLTINPSEKKVCIFWLRPVEYFAYVSILLCCDRMYIRIILLQWDNSNE